MDSKREKAEDDRLSSLPDSLLLHILSLLETKHAIATCVLSNRWRNLWNFIPNLDFQGCHYPIDDSNFIRLVDKSLINHVAPKIHKFRLCFFYCEDHASDVDVWLRFAVKKRVEEIDLGFDHDALFPDEYKLPRWLFECETLVSLKLSGCTFDLTNFGCFSSIAVLSLEEMKLTTQMLRDLLERCPLLEVLVIERCYFPDTSLCISSSSNSRLKHLKVSDAYGMNGVEVDAPSLQILNFSVVGVESQCSFKDMPFLIEGNIELDMFTHVTDYTHGGRRDLSSLELTVQNLRHAKKLELTSCCIQAMHPPTLKDLHSCIFKTKHLKLEIGLQNVELPGLANLLWSSPDLETLDIHLMHYDSYEVGPVYGSIGEGSFTRKVGFDVKDYWESVTVSFPCLKSVSISNFIRFEGGKCGDLNNEINLVGFLLRNAIVLENINIEAYRDHGEEEWQKILSNVTEKLTAIPQASPYVELWI